MKKAHFALGLFWIALAIWFLTAMEMPICLYGFLYLVLGFSNLKEAYE